MIGWTPVAIEGLEVANGGHLNANKTQCPHGHDYTPENTRLGMSKGCVSRYCRACERLYGRKPRPKVSA